MGVAIAGAPAAAHAQCEPVWSGLGGHDGWGGGAMAVYDEDGAGPLAPALFVSGLGDIRVIARWDGWRVSAVGDGPHDSFNGLDHLEPVPEPIGMLPAGLYAGGDIDVAGGVPVNDLARWLAPEWHDVGGGVSRQPGQASFVFAMTIFDEDGAGPLLPALFVGGLFESAGGVPVDGLAKWDGSQWSDVGGGLRDRLGPGRVSVYAMTVYDDGRGPALYAAGDFDSAGGAPAYNIARWDGASWEPVGSGLGATVESLCVFDEDGPGPKKPALFAGGQFSRAVGGEPMSLVRIGRWDGSEWTSVGGWRSSGAVLAMHVWDQDGPGPGAPNLYIGGLFSTMPDLSPANKIARWDGEDWHALGGGVAGFGAGTHVNTLAAFDEDGPGPNPGGLYVGGAFYYAGGVYSKHIARWGCPLGPRPCYADCDQSGALDFLDFLCFQNAFAAAAPSADCDQSTTLDFFDFLCFQNAFAAGCP